MLTIGKCQRCTVMGAVTLVTELAHEIAGEDCTHVQLLCTECAGLSAKVAGCPLVTWIPRR